jgi:hypothetical protein
MKLCTGCNTEKQESEFNKKGGTKDGLNYLCKLCSRERSRTFYHNNRASQKRKKYRKRRLLRNEYKHRILILKSGRTCCVSGCVESEPCALEFHHVNALDKLDDIGHLVQNGSSWSVIANEITKCIIICSNHHKKYHAGHIVLSDEEIRKGEV